MTPSSTHLLFNALTVCMLCLSAADAASLVVDQSLIIGSENHSSNPGGAPAYHISLNAAKAGFAAINYQTADKADGENFTVAFKDAIQGYHFVQANPANTIATVISKGVSISARTTDDAFDSFNSDAAKIWLSSNPGADLEKPADRPDFTAGIRDISNIRGSIDISGLASGTVYFFYGDCKGRPSIIAAMVDHDGPEPGIVLTNFHNGDLANRSERYMSSLTFVNDAGYDTIEYDFSGKTGRWDGVVVAGKVIP